jgi:hypothetical protein
MRFTLFSSSLKSVFTPSAIFSGLMVTILLGLSACDSDSIPGPDFSQVPEPVDISGITPSDTLSNGTIIYIVEESSESFGELTIRDTALMQFSSWRDAGLGEVLDSTYEGGNMEPLPVNVLNLTFGGSSRIATSDYFRFMVAGMKEGEFRSALVPPDASGLPDTLRYDIELHEILD